MQLAPFHQSTHEIHTKNETITTQKAVWVKLDWDFGFALRFGESNTSHFSGALTFPGGFLLLFSRLPGRLAVFLARLTTLWTRDSWDLRQVGRRRLGQRRVAALQQECPVVYDARAWKSQCTGAQ